MITSRDNPAVKHIARLGRDNGYRHEHKLMLCEGVKLLREALDAGVEPVHAVFTHEPDVRLPESTRILEVHESVMKSITRLESPPRVLFTAAIPAMQLEKPCGGSHIILDRMQDPGNVGSIIRTACAFGVASVVLTPGCADISNPKTLRAAMGAVFRQCVVYAEPEDVWEAFKTYKCYTTGTRPDAKPLQAAELNGCAVLIGNEGAGLSDFWLSKGLEMLTIPIEFESLGAANAAAIIMWETAR